MRIRQRAAAVATALACVASVAGPAAWAHSASDAYLTITADPGRSVLHAQWDVALRDLEFVLGIDDNGDGKITWGELRRHQARIARYVYARIKFSSGGKSCRVDPTGQQVDEHADGSYAVLLFEIRCDPGTPPTPSLDYTLFFDIDPSHRGILVLHRGTRVSTALLSPDNSRIELK